MNSFGRLFRITTFGESHGVAIGVVVDGCPSGLTISEETIQVELDRRRPGQSSISTQRKEEDKCEILSGIFEGKTTGAPIAILIKNKDHISSDYDALKDVFRPGHADYTYFLKYGNRDHRGGGRASARETATRVAAGAIAKTFLRKLEMEILAFVSKVGTITSEVDLDFVTSKQIEANAVRCPDKKAAIKMQERIEEYKAKGDSLGGVVTCICRNIPTGLGEPLFDKLQAILAHAMLSLPAAKGFEIGSGFAGAELPASLHNDNFEGDEATGRITTSTNHSGGVQGGISNGQDIVFKVAFKAPSTITQPQNTVDKEGNSIILEARGRHDPCVVPRAVPIVEAMAALVLADAVLLSGK